MRDSLDQFHHVSPAWHVGLLWGEVLVVGMSLLWDARWSISTMDSCVLKESTHTYEKNQPIHMRFHFYESKVSMDQSNPRLDWTHCNQETWSNNLGFHKVPFWAAQLTIGGRMKNPSWPHGDRPGRNRNLTKSWGLTWWDLNHQQLGLHLNIWNFKP